MTNPRIEINLKKIAHNARTLTDLYGSDGIAVVGVTKSVCGHPEIAATLVENGIEMLGDSRLSNITYMKKMGVETKFLLLRTPMLSETEAVAQDTDCSLNSEILVLESLSKFAIRLGVIHCVVLMVEMGDLREGIMPSDLDQVVSRLLALKGLKLVGLGTNLACMGGITPDAHKMDKLSSLAAEVEEKFSITLQTISGGNSANYTWFMKNTDHARINSLRLGESIFLGCETLERKAIPGLYTDAFQLVTEVIEVQTKPSVPYGQAGQNAFGETPVFEDKGKMRRAILAIGQQDVMISDLEPLSAIQVISASSDHVVIDTRKTNLQVGQEVKFSINYAALLSLMTSPYVSKSIVA